MNEQGQKIKELEEQISRLKSSVSQLRALNDIAISSGKATDVDQILNLIVQKSISAIEAEQGAILLVTKNKNKQFKTYVRQDDTSSLRHNYHIGINITGWVLENKKPLIIEDLSHDERFSPTEDERRDIKSVLCVPIWFEGDIIGLMTLINKKNKKRFSHDDITLFSIISVQAGQLIKNLELQKKAFQKMKESEKLQELDRLKTNFFTDISHEFRTPLTLILGQAKQILENREGININELADVIFRNGAKLKNLTNQILDLSRIEAGQMKLRASPQNLIPVINSTVSSFQSLADTKKISLKFNAHKEKLILHFDRDKMEKIISNLLSNALKFTPEGGRVEVGASTDSDAGQKKNEAGREFAEIIVSDNGIGISKGQLNKIFDRYYQADNKIMKTSEGTGIGLSLTRELVELHKGKISVDSKEGKGTEFKLLFPMGKEHLLPEQIIENDTDTESKKVTDEGKIKQILSSISKSSQKGVIKNIDSGFTSGNKTNKPGLLVIEDNYDLRKYIKDILHSFYKITEAPDGREGLKRAFDKIPDLIISDIMMPGLDGMELCQELKSDTRTSHIPLILLTARSTTSDKIEGLESGADDYIVKPFEADELKARIKNLLRQRERIHKHFQKYGFLVDESEVTSIDQEFLKQTLAKINEHLPDSGFSVEMLAEELAMSRSLLHKKLVALVGESPSDLIRRIRLNKAAKLVEQNSGNISEIALEVGFNNPSYFAKCFQKQFGFNPSRYHRKISHK